MVLKYGSKLVVINKPRTGSRPSGGAGSYSSGWQLRMPFVVQKLPFVDKVGKGVFRVADSCIFG